MFRSIAERGDDEDRLRARVALAISAQPRRERLDWPARAAEGRLAKRRIVRDAASHRALPGRIAREEGGLPAGDAAVDDAYENTGRAYDYFRRVHGRRSVDDRGAVLDSTVHFGVAFNNAHWNGHRMIFGDGDGKYFRGFTSLDVVVHELAHGVSQYVAGFGASGQNGALAEHFSDVFGTLAEQYWQKHTAARAGWLIGANLFLPRVNGIALRSLKAPGTAYDDPILGRDPQPAHMRDYVRTAGPHVGSGIPNHAFYQTATLLGGRAWETAGRIWYHALTHGLGTRSRFQQCADVTWRAAGELFGEGSAPQEAVRAGWLTVGLEISATVLDRGPRLRVRRRRPRETYEPPAAGAESPLFLVVV